MSTTDNLADPIVSSFVSILCVPLNELYALLWRVGVVEIRHDDQPRGRASRLVARVAPGPRRPVCPDPSAHGSHRPRPQSPQRPHRAYRQAAG
ncbi:Rv1535 domain-containing protein [Mycobacterium rhizamassiliense]|uniref:Rv1535 domain-containing protein n=1 Tax=Mycobacterium rhizamassiliense TaxID=1841860 RepID=UPI00097D8FB1|nr:Rv1535 domain-containing protein [Mycobacterium rhizamassiliense]